MKALQAGDCASAVTIFLTDTMADVYLSMPDEEKTKVRWGWGCCGGS
jgi:hypothetical protein